MSKAPVSPAAWGRPKGDTILEGWVADADREAALSAMGAVTVAQTIAILRHFLMGVSRPFEGCRFGEHGQPKSGDEGQGQSNRRQSVSHGSLRLPLKAS